MVRSKTINATNLVTPETLIENTGERFSRSESINVSKISFNVFFESLIHWSEGQVNIHKILFKRASNSLSTNLRSIRPILWFHTLWSNQPPFATLVSYRRTSSAIPFDCLWVCRIWNTLDTILAGRRESFCNWWHKFFELNFFSIWLTVKTILCFTCKQCIAVDVPVVVLAALPLWFVRLIRPRKPIAYLDRLLLKTFFFYCMKSKSIFWYMCNMLWFIVL